VIRLCIFANELRKAKGTSKPMMLVPLHGNFDRLNPGSE
jgi:hypothetical protein